MPEGSNPSSSTQHTYLLLTLLCPPPLSPSLQLSNLARFTHSEYSVPFLTSLLLAHFAPSACSVLAWQPGQCILSFSQMVTFSAPPTISFHPRQLERVFQDTNCMLTLSCLKLPQAPQPISDKIQTFQLSLQDLFGQDSAVSSSAFPRLVPFTPALCPFIL